MALSADKVDSRGKVHGRTQEGVIKDADVIYRGAMVNWNQATPVTMEAATDGATHSFAGVAIRGGTGITAATVLAVVERRGTRWLPFSGTVDGSEVGFLAYVVDDEEVNLVGVTTNDIIVGKIIDYDIANNLLEVDLQDRVA